MTEGTLEPRAGPLEGRWGSVGPAPRRGVGFSGSELFRKLRVVNEQLSDSSSVSLEPSFLFYFN